MSMYIPKMYTYMNSKIKLTSKNKISYVILGGSSAEETENLYTGSKRLMKG